MIFFVKEFEIATVFQEGVFIEKYSLSVNTFVASSLFSLGIPSE